MAMVMVDPLSNPPEVLDNSNYIFSEVEISNRIVEADKRLKKKMKQIERKERRSWARARVRNIEIIK